MDESRPMTKRELKALRRLEKLDTNQEESKQNKIKWILLAGGSLLFLAFFGFLIFLAKQGNARPAVIIAPNGHVRGLETATLALVEYGDFQCPACKTYHPIVREVLAAYDGRLKLVFKHFPLTSVHPNAAPAALSAEAAGAQGKFFEMHDILYERQSEWAGLTPAHAQEKFISYARQLKLDEEKFTEDIKNKELEGIVRAHQEEGIENGVSSTPTFFLNGKIIQNPRSVDEFKKLIDEELKR